MYHVRTIAFILVLLFTGPRLLLAQVDQGATEHRLRELERQIERDRARLDEATEAERSSLSTLQSVEREIALREELGRVYRDRMREIALQTDSLQRSMAGLQQQVGELRKQYQRRATHAYKYGRLHDVALILAANSINEMILRARYLNRFADQRRRKLEDITRMGALLKARRDTLDSMRVQNVRLLQEAEVQERSLLRLQSDRRQVVSGLRNQRSTLQANLERSQAAASELQLRIRRLHEADVRRPAEPEAAAPRLSGTFRMNQGRLPWPVTGAIIEPYGERVNPLYGTRTSSPGILISTPPGGQVHAVFGGEVLMIDTMPEYGTLVTISHGEYKTVYSNFSRLSVREGDRVAAGQVLGQAGGAGSPKGEALFFAVFYNGKPVDPVPWLLPR